MSNAPKDYSDEEYKQFEENFREKVNERLDVAMDKIYTTFTLADKIRWKLMEYPFTSLYIAFVLGVFSGILLF